MSTPSALERPARKVSFGIMLRERVNAAWLGWWLLFFTAAVALYWIGLRAGYFSDDLLFFFNSPPQHLYHYFSIRGGAAQAYRPLEAILLTLIQQHFWFNTLPIHLCSLAGHAALVCAVLFAGPRLAMRAGETALACAFTLLAQVSAPAVLGNDCFSQVASTVFGSVSALFLCYAWIRRKEAEMPQRPGKWFWLSVAAYTISLFFKETALGYFLVAMLFAALIAYEELTWFERWKKAILLAIPYGAATLIYFAARLHAGGAVSKAGTYQIHLGFNVIRNLAEFALAAFGPFSTVNGAIAVSLHRKAELLLQMTGFVVVIALLVAGAYLSRRRLLCGSLAILAFASLFPAYLLTHVSELYLYNAVPFLGLLFGIALAALWDRKRLLRFAAVPCVALFFLAQVASDEQKAWLMSFNGKRAALIMSEIATLLPALPPDSEILLLNPPHRTPEYSVFLLNGFDVVDIGTLRIGPIFGRPDVRVQVVEQAEGQSLEPRGDRLLFTPGPDGHLKPYTGLER